MAAAYAERAFPGGGTDESFLYVHGSLPGFNASPFSVLLTASLSAVNALPPPDSTVAVQAPGDPFFSLSGIQTPAIMVAKPKLYYTNGRGRMDSIRWLLAAAGVEFEEEFMETREDYEKLIKDGVLLFEQTPMVEIDGMKMVQTRAILNYIASKYNLYGKDLNERALIDMYVGGTTDLMDLVMMYPFLPSADKEKRLDLIIQRATTRYFPVYEKVLKQHGQDFLVGNRLSCADVHLLEAILSVEELQATILSSFPLLQAFKSRTSSIPTIAKFLQPGSQRKPPTSDALVATVKAIYQMN